MKLKAEGKKMNNKKVQITPNRFLYKVVEYKSCQMSNSQGW